MEITNSFIEGGNMIQIITEALKIASGSLAVSTPIQTTPAMDTATKAILLSPEIATMIAGFGGAIIGGLISYFVARQSAKESQKRETQQETRKIKTELFCVQLKVISIMNGLYTIKKMIEDGETIAKINKVPLWQYVQQMPVSSSPISFEPSEFTEFIYDNGAGLISSICLIADRYSAILDGMNVYSELRSKFQLFVEPYTHQQEKSLSSEGSYVTQLPEDIAQAANLKMYELEKLIRQLQSSVEEDLVQAKEITFQVNNYATVRMEKRGSTFIKIDIS